MEPYNDCWIYSGSAKERLWDKSAIGQKINGNDLLLSPPEVIFCHDHRHLEWPTENWLDEETRKNPDLINESIILEAVRVPGNKIILTNYYKGKSKLIFNEKTWGLRWNSDCHPRDESPVSEVRWFHSSEYIEINELLSWAIDASSRNRIAEVLIVDNEQAVVTYNITSENPVGELSPPDDIDIGRILNIFKTVKLEREGTIYSHSYFPSPQPWPFEQIGIDWHGDRYLDDVTEEYMMGTGSLESQVFADLIERGLHPRPGFKYGTKWRCYEKKIGTEHAPWLVSSPKNNLITWENACLASRLASGVNKTWLQPLKIDSVWKYIGIIRPPANSRWTNPIKK